MNENLTPSARPGSVRVVDDMAFTASRTLKKSDLSAAGSDPLRVERVYRYDDERGTYTPLDAAAYAAPGG